MLSLFQVRARVYYPLKLVTGVGNDPNVFLTKLGLMKPSTLTSSLSRDLKINQLYPLTEGVYCCLKHGVRLCNTVRIAAP